MQKAQKSIPIGFEVLRPPMKEVNMKNVKKKTLNFFKKWYFSKFIDPLKKHIYRIWSEKKFGNELIHS